MMTNKLDLYKGTLKATREREIERRLDLDDLNRSYQSGINDIEIGFSQSMDDLKQQMNLILESVDIPEGMEQVNLLGHWHISIERDGNDYEAFCGCGYVIKHRVDSITHYVKPLTSLAEINCPDCIEAYLENLNKGYISQDGSGS